MSVYYLINNSKIISDRWSELKDRMHDFLSTFSHGSQELLRYVGLLPD
jgi:hypothetical protein